VLSMLSVVSMVSVESECDECGKGGENGEHGERGERGERGTPAGAAGVRALNPSAQICWIVEKAMQPVGVMRCGAPNKRSEEPHERHRVLRSLWLCHSRVVRQVHEAEVERPARSEMEQWVLEQWVLRTAAPHLKFVPWLTDTAVFSAWRNNETLATTWPIRIEFTRTELRSTVWLTTPTRNMTRHFCAYENTCLAVVKKAMPTEGGERAPPGSLLMARQTMQTGPLLPTPLCIHWLRCGLNLYGTQRFYPPGTRRFYLYSLAEYRSPNHLLESLPTSVGTRGSVV
jgi:hypothetical protein